MVESYERKGASVITLVPNQSASSLQNIICFVALTLISAIVALGWWVVGVWVILPFAGLEIALLGYFLKRVYQATRTVQTVTLHMASVWVQTNALQCHQSICFPREGAKFSVASNGEHDLIHETYLFNTQQRVQLGVFLNTADKRHLVAELQRHGLPRQNYVASSLLG